MNSPFSAEKGLRRLKNQGSSEIIQENAAKKQ